MAASGFSIDPDWWESVDKADARHPQTLLTWAKTARMKLLTLKPHLTEKRL